MIKKPTSRSELGRCADSGRRNGAWPCEFDHSTARVRPCSARLALNDNARVDWLFRNRQTGEITVGQAPNAALIVFLVATVVHHAFSIRGNTGTGLTIVSTGALTVWSADELLRGVNPFRRLLGAVVLAGIMASVVF